MIEDAALYIKRKYGKVIGVCGSYVDGSLNAGRDDFQKLTEKTLHMFESEPGLYNCFGFYGAQVERTAESGFKVLQKYCIEKFDPAPLSATSEGYPWYPALFSRIEHNQSDLLCPATEMAQVC